MSERKPYPSDLSDEQWALITEPARIIDLNIHRYDRLGGILHEYSDAA